jgi:hypothetical protein
LVVLDLVLIGMAVTLEPIPITAFILSLSAKRGSVKGAEFILGWLLSLVVVIAGVILITGGKPPKSKTAPSTAALAIKIALGVILILIAVRQQRRSARPRKPPTWMSKLDNMSGWAAAGLGVFLQLWVLVAVGAATVAQLHVSSIESYALLVGFCLLCTASILAMELFAVFSPEAHSDGWTACGTGSTPTATRRSSFSR